MRLWASWRQQDLSWMPRNNAIVLREVTMAEEAESRTLRESVQHVRAEVDKLAAAPADCACADGLL